MISRITTTLKFAAVLSSMFIALAFSSIAESASYTAITGGNWSADATWSGSGAPVAVGDNATLQNPFALILDVSVAGLNEVYIAGGGGSLDLNGNTIGVTGNFHLGGAAGSGIISRTGGGTISANTMRIEDGSTFTFAAGDVVSSLILQSGTVNVTTAVTGNVTTRFEKSTPGSINLGANLSVLGDNIYVGGGGASIMNMNGFDVSTNNTIVFGSNGPSTTDGTGKLFSTNLNVNDGSLAIVKGGTIGSGISMDGNSANTLRVLQAAAQVDGLTLNGGSFSLNGGKLNLVFDGSPSGALGTNPANFDWAFRWKGDHELFLEGLIGSSLTSNATLTTAQIRYIGGAEDYTYVGFEAQVADVPEPSTFVLAAMGLAGLGLLAWRRKCSRFSFSFPGFSFQKELHMIPRITSTAKLAIVLAFAMTVSVISLSTTSTAYGSYASTVLADNPVGYWRFEDASVANAQTAVNSATSGAVLNGSYINGTGLSQVVNPFAGLGKSLNLDNSSATDDGVVVADNALIDFNTTMSMEVWFLRPSGSTIDGNTRILDKNDNPGYILLQGGSNEAQSYFQTNFYAASGPLSADAWHHIVVTYDGGITTSKVYVDGALVNTNNGSPASIGINGAPFGIGINQSNNPNNEDFHGRLDEVALYSGVLSLAQVQAHYNARNDASAVEDVPEPSTFVLAALGLAGLGLLAWRRTKGNC